MSLDATLRLRIDKSVKKILAEAAGKSGITLSNYARLLLGQAAKTPYRLKRSRS